MKNSIYIIVTTLLLLGCGNSSRNSPTTADTDSIMEVPATYDTIPSPENSTVPQTTVQGTYYAPVNNHDSSNSEPYDEGYEQGYSDGEEDGYSHSGYQASFDSSNDYRGKASDEYEDGYEKGYEDGYNDNAESDDE